MESYYLEGEEKFGLLYSFGYFLLAKLPQMKSFYSFVVKDLLDSGSKELIDIGTGPGDIPIMLAKSEKFRVLCAVDPSRDMIRIARRRAAGLNVIFAQGSSRKIGFNRKFSLVSTALSFHHWARKEDSLIYLSSLLKKDGEIRIYEYERKVLPGILKWFTSSHSVTEKELYEVALKSSLKIKNIKKEGGFIRAIITR